MDFGVMWFWVWVVVGVGCGADTVGDFCWVCIG